MESSNTIFEKAVAFVNQTNQNIFLTGKAGTGKTTFLKHITSHTHKKMAVVAPTGVAAINAGGVTMHSFFSLPFGTFIPSFKPVWGGENLNIYNEHQLLSNMKLNAIKRDLIKNLDTLIIDEISMVRADILDAIDAILRFVRNKERVPFGGVQLVFIGDMFQLPPVVKDEEWEIMKEYYASPFFFDAKVMKENEPVYVELKKIYRQSDDQFINLLNHIRNNDCTENDFELLGDYYEPHFEPSAASEYITLTTHNYKAEEINFNALDQIPAEEIFFDAKISGEFPENAFPITPKLGLKTGAQIMFIKNDKGESRRYFNGKIGTVSKIDKDTKELWVKFSNESEPFKVEPEVWRNIRYRLDKEKDKVEEEELGTFTQYPIRLAWAVTIHKSQGLTFEKAVVDAGQAFAAGQVYVALSRLTGLSGLKLKSKITQSSIYTDPRIIEFSKLESSEESLNNQLRLSQQIFAEQSILDAFNFIDLYHVYAEFAQEMGKRGIADKEIALNWVQQLSKSVDKMGSVGQKFKTQLEQILTHNPIDYTLLEERTQAAANWFLTILLEVIEDIKKHYDEFKIKAKTKKYLVDLKFLLQEFEKKKLKVSQAAAVTTAISNNLGITEVMHQVDKMFDPITIETLIPDEKIKVTAKKGITKEVSFELFKEGYTIPEIAKQRSMVESTILGHLTSYISEDKIKIEDLVAKDVVEKIMAVITKNPEGGLAEFKAELPNEYSFNDIRAVWTYATHLKSLTKE